MVGSVNNSCMLVLVVVDFVGISDEEMLIRIIIVMVMMFGVRKWFVCVGFVCFNV